MTCPEGQNTHAPIPVQPGPIAIPTAATALVVKETAERYGMTSRDLLGHARKRPVSVVRALAYSEVRRRRPHLAGTQVAAVFGRDHTTVYVGIAKHQARMAWVEFLRACVPPPSDQLELFQ